MGSQGSAGNQWGPPDEVILDMDSHPAEAHGHHFHIVTNYTEEEMSGEEVLYLYRQRGGETPKTKM